MSFETLIHFFKDYLYPALLVLFFFGLTIFIHEFGHFWVAKRRGMKIERFSIGFGPKIFSWNKNGIEYRLSWIPFGGYVALPQMSPMEAIEGKTESETEKFPPAPPASKIQVAFAGPIMNIGLALVLACFLWAVGSSLPINPPVVGWVEPGSREEQLGLLAGDRVIEVDGREIKTWMDISRAVVLSLEPSVLVVTEREGQSHRYLLETELNEEFSVKTINLYPQIRPYARKINPGSPAEEAGILSGDQFLSMQGLPVGGVQSVIDIVQKHPDQPITVKLIRDGEVKTLVVVPRMHPKSKKARIGVHLGEKLEYKIVRPGPTPWLQFREVLGMMGDTLYALIHHKDTGVGIRSMSGPVGIAGSWWYQIVGGGIRRGLWFAVLLNINLAIINLLPIPVLDGGHIVFSIIESIRRRPVNARFVQAASTTFAVLIISFMLYVTFFDIQRFFPGFSSKSTPEETNSPASASQPAIEP